MKQILMHRHNGPLTFLKYNSQGDLLFSCADDETPILWHSDNGEIIGTYKGHTDTVWSCDVSRDSTRLITASADRSVKLWHVQSGGLLYTFNFDAPARSVEFSDGDDRAVITTDPFKKSLSSIHVKKVAKDPSKKTEESLIEIESPGGRINRAVWGPLNSTIISAGEDSIIRIWDTETGKLLEQSHKVSNHTKQITALSKSTDGSQLLTGSSDKSAKLWDIQTLTLIKTYKDEEPVNAVAISPLFNHVVIGGGESVVLAHPRAKKFEDRKFETKFFHKVKEKKIGVVRGHLQPISALAFNPDGTSFSTGSRDGYVGLYHLDGEYFKKMM